MTPQYQPFAAENWQGAPLRNVKMVRDRHGKPRYYFQVKGRPLIRLPNGPTDSAEFLDAWRKAAGIDEGGLVPVSEPGLMLVGNGPMRGKYVVHKRGAIVPVRAKPNTPEMAMALKGASHAAFGRDLHDDILATLAKSVKRAASRAKDKGRRFSITLDDMVTMYRAQEGRCALTGMMFYAEERDAEERRSPWTPSIDRIDSRKGYTVDNVHLVSTMANVAKAEFSVADFHRMCAEAAVNKGLLSIAVKK